MPVAAQEVSEATPVVDETPTAVATETPLPTETETPDATEEPEVSTPAPEQNAPSLSRNSISVQADPTIEFGIDSTTFTNLALQQEVSWTSTIRLPEGHSFTDISGEYTLDSLQIAGELGGGPNEFYLQFSVNTIEPFASTCLDDHSVILRLAVSLEHEDGTSVSIIRSQKVPCTFDYENLTLVTVDGEYIQFVVCGIGSYMQINDIIEWVPQEGVQIDSESWGNGERLIYVKPAPGYVFESGLQVELIRVRDNSTICDSSVLSFDDTSTVLEGMLPGEEVKFHVELTVPEENPFSVADVNLVINNDARFKAIPLFNRSVSETWQVDFTYTVPDDFEAICAANNGVISFDLTADLSGPNGPYPAVFKEFLEDSGSLPCSVATSVIPDVDMVEQNVVCGSNNDEFTTSQQGVEISAVTWSDNTAVVSLVATDGYYIPTDTQSDFEFVDEGPCLVTPIPPETEAVVCGPNNDLVTIQEQPEGVQITDTGWVSNQRTITWEPTEGYIFPENTPIRLVAFDENTTCDEEPDGVQLTVILKTSDGASIEGTQYQVYAPTASQATQLPYVEGVVDANNQIVLQGLVPGEYRLVIAPEGYDPIDTILTVTDDADMQEITISVNAIQVPATQTPEPTQEATPEPSQEVTPEPTDEATVAPTPAASDPGSVTGLPQTGVGPDNSSLIVGIGGLLAAAIVMMAVGRRMFR